MPLALQLVTRPVRVAGLVALAAAVAFLSAATVLGAQPTAMVTAVAALAASGTAIGALAPLYGRGAAIGLWTTRAGIAMGAGALVLLDGRDATALRVGAVLAVVGAIHTTFVSAQTTVA